MQEPNLDFLRSLPDYQSGPYYSLGNNPAVRWGLIIQSLDLQKEEKERAMNMAKVSDAKAVAINVNAEQNSHESDAREHLSGRVTSAYYEKMREGRKQFYMDDDEFYPKSPKELIDRIQKGDFKFNKKNVNEDGTWKEENSNRPMFDYYDVFHQLRWRTKDADQKGFEEFHKKLRKMEQETQDEVLVLPLEDGLKALRTFEGATVQ